MTDHPNRSADSAELEIWRLISEDVKERIAEGDGMWATCSGCHESVDGHSLGYPHSKVFGCRLGSGCSECGGIGAVWDTTDYEHMGRTLAAEMLTGDAAQSVGMREALQGLLEIEEARISSGAFRPNEEAQRRINNARAALASQPSPAATVNKKTRCESCNLLEPCADPQCPNSTQRCSAGTSDGELMDHAAGLLSNYPCVANALRERAAELYRAVPQPTPEMVSDLVAGLKYVAEFPINNSQRQHAQQVLGRFASRLSRPHSRTGEA